MKYTHIKASKLPEPTSPVPKPEKGDDKGTTYTGSAFAGAKRKATLQRGINGLLFVVYEDPAL